MKDSREFKDSVIRGAVMDLLSAGRLVAFDDHGLVRVMARKYAKRYAAKHGAQPLSVEIALQRIRAEAESRSRRH
jgi:hypothetical protein